MKLFCPRLYIGNGYVHMDNSKVKLFCEYALEEHEDSACMRFFNEWIAKVTEDGIMARHRDSDGDLQILLLIQDHGLEEIFLNLCT